MISSVELEPGPDGRMMTEIVKETIDSSTATLHSEQLDTNTKCDTEMTRGNKEEQNDDVKLYAEFENTVPAEHDDYTHNADQVDNRSCGSDTPLIKTDDMDAYTNKYYFANESRSQTKGPVPDQNCYDYSKMPIANGTILRTNDEIIVEEIKCPQLHVIGSGWEFGSISSIHLQGREGVRSRTNTMDQNSLKFSHQNRLLTKVFANLGSLDFSKKGIDIESLNTSFISTNEEAYADSKVKESTNARKNMKNLFAVSACMLFLHISIYGLRNLLSSLNSEGGVGVYSLAAYFAAFMLGSLISPFIVRKFLPKSCITVGCIAQLLFTVSNYMPYLSTIIPSSLLSGFGGAIMWNAVCTYITELGMNEANRKNKFAGHILSRYFGMLFVSLQLSMVLGNLISSLILKSPVETGENVSQILNLTFVNHVHNASVFPDSVNVTEHSVRASISNDTATSSCGIRYCDIDQESSSGNTEVDELNKLFLLGTYSCCAVIAILVVQFCVAPLPNYISYTSSFNETRQQVCSVLMMVFDAKFSLLIVMCLYTVTSNSFVIADVLKGYVTCPLGIYMVGYSMICFGLCGAISSFIFGKLVKCIGILSVFIVAAALNLASLAFMFTWEPSADDTYYIFGLLGAFGFADGIWQSQFNGLLSSVFADRYEDAFGCCRVLQGVAGIVVFTMSNSCCMQTKVIFAAVTCILALVLYIIMEIMRSRERTT